MGSQHFGILFLFRLLFSFLSIFCSELWAKDNMKMNSGGRYNGCFEQVTEMTTCHVSFLRSLIQHQYFSKRLIHDMIKRFSSYSSDTGVVYRLQTNEKKEYIITLGQQVEIPPQFTSILKFSSSRFRKYTVMVFDDVLFFLRTLLHSFLSVKNINLRRYRQISSTLVIIGRAPVTMEKYSKGSWKCVHVHSCFTKLRKWKEIDLFPYSRFILRCVHSRPCFDFDHHSYYWKEYISVQEHYRPRDKSKTFCEILKKFSNNNIYFVKLVLRKRRNICLYSEEENRYIGSLSSI